MQDFTGVPCIVDLATMREAMADLGGDPAKINPLSPAEMVIDHSVIIDVFGRADAFERNVEIEYQRNRERYQFLRWGQTAFDDFKVVPPGTGIVHQVNIEHLARTVMVRNGVAYPDTCVGTDSHTTMVNGLGVLGWGVGGIEAEAAMLGQPVSMLIPRVVGFKLSGSIPAGATATDVVLTITEMLRKHGVVGKFVEFYGDGVAAVPLANRATIGNMSPEFGSTCAIFPIDDVTLDYLRLTGRSDESVALVEAYAREQGMWHDPSVEPRFSERLELDLSTVVPSIAGPKRPQDRIALTDAKSAFRKVLPTYVAHDEGDSGVGASFPASDPTPQGAPEGVNGGSKPADEGDGSSRPHKKVAVTTAEGATFEIDHGIVSIASITSCTNTSNPSVMMAAAMLAKNAVERGLTVAPWVKTSMAPGSKVVTNYYEKAGMWPYLEKLGFFLVGYGCTTCIGNSGPLDEAISAAVQENDLAVVSVLSGNRNFEGRINPDVKMNYLASPPLVIAYALAGTMDFDFESQPLGQDTDGADVYLRDIWPAPQDVERTIASSINQEMFTSDYADVFAGDERWTSLPTPEGKTFEWDGESTYVRKPPYFDGMSMDSTPVGGHLRSPGPGQAGRLRDDRPHQPRRVDQGRQPGRHLPRRARRRPQGLQLLRLAARQPRGDDPRHVRQHPPEEPPPRRGRGRVHPQLPLRHTWWGAGDDLRRVGRLPGRRCTAGHPRGQGVWLGVVARLGGQGDPAPRGARGHRRELRADPPVQPHRDGGPAAAVPGRRERRLARSRRHRDLHLDGDHRPQRGTHPAYGECRCHEARFGRRRVRRGRPDRHPGRGRLLPRRRHPPVRPAVARQRLSGAAGPPIARLPTARIPHGSAPSSWVGASVVGAVNVREGSNLGQETHLSGSAHPKPVIL